MYSQRGSANSGDSVKEIILQQEKSKKFASDRLIREDSDWVKQQPGAVAE
eukprot:CAMPEP_0170458978 /NCGR_PEP_ID=MMETSP0123-20130129/5797_1 /TAXON_ID=182087 /ORGANISM="Favella ehrenbergii, Strain Fehren 1" /LENGTH=49 /DNA_ID=CAMNT_0010723365 /DNA_START=560 /DNA_END=709 /DNA_ORIENTATION=+